jgi:aldehyde oxidoreductase
MKKINLKVNGRLRQILAHRDLVLLDMLRDIYNLTGAKQSCDRKGQCGACMVIVNGKAVLSCLVKVISLEGADIITVEGLGTPDNPHLIQEAFVLAGAIQCGFCTPGMIMTAKALLDTNPNPTTQDIKTAFRRNLCRCTGYMRIIEAVKLAGRFLRGETTPEKIRPRPDDPKIGVSHPRPSAMIKACGVAEFGADIKLPGAIEVAAVRSPHEHALIKSIDTSEAERMPGVLGVLTAKDIKGTNILKSTVPDRPLICGYKVHQIGDAVAVVAAETLAQALAAAKAVKVDYELLPTLTSPREAMAEGAIQVHDDRPNVCFKWPLVKGDADEALAASAVVVEGNFCTQINHLAPLEPEVSLAFLEEGKGDDEPVLVIVGRSINIHAHVGVLQQALGYENIRYEEPYSGGQFGIKIEVITEGIAGAAALHFKRPVRYVPSLEETLMMTSKCYAYDIDLKLGADADGKLTGLAVDMLVDNGAYESNGKITVQRSFYMLSSSYYIPHIKGEAKLIYTNNPWGSAARGAGAPQSHFAVECAMDMLADKLNMDPLEFRLLNSLKPGETQATGHFPDQWPFPELCEAIRPAYERAKKETANHKNGTIRRGVGLGATAYGIGRPTDKAMAFVELDADDCVTVYAAAADPGEGNDSMLTQLAAQVLELPLNKIRIVTRDTDRTAASGPASGSRITYLIGGAAVDGCKKLKQVMDEVGAKTYNALKDAGKPTRYQGEKRVIDSQVLSAETGLGPAYESNVHCIQMAEVEVNVDTGDVRVDKMTVAMDAGTIIHPLNVIGQLEGGADMGVGYALREEYITHRTKDWVTFEFPTMKTSFDIDTIIRETPRVNGTLGATGVGEMSMTSTAPAVINAVKDACGVWVTQLPATRDKVKAALTNSERPHG